MAGGPVYSAGECVSFPEDFATELIEGGLAKLDAEKPKEKPEDKGQPRAAVIDGAPKDRQVHGAKGSGKNDG